MRLPSCSCIKQYTYVWINDPVKKSVEKNLYKDNSCVDEYSVSNRHFKKVKYPLTFQNRASYIYRTGVPLPTKCCILYIFSTNISTEYFKHAANSPFFSSKCRLFHNATFFDSCIIYSLHTECAKI
jgi:hypothetical protein